MNHKNMMNIIEYIKDRIIYDPKTGIFRWKKTIRSHIIKGKIIGTLDGSGYNCIKLNRNIIHWLELHLC